MTLLSVRKNSCPNLGWFSAQEEAARVKLLGENLRGENLKRKEGQNPIRLPPT
jgi:hypothetical protein